MNMEQVDYYTHKCRCESCGKEVYVRARLDMAYTYRGAREALLEGGWNDTNGVSLCPKCNRQFERESRNGR